MRKAIVATAAVLAMLASAYVGVVLARAPLPQRSVAELPAGYIEPSASFLREYAEIKRLEEDLKQRATAWGQTIPKTLCGTPPGPCFFDQQMLAFRPFTDEERKRAGLAPAPAASGPAPNPSGPPDAK